MTRIDTSALETGMLLANDVRDLNGRFLMGKGTRLTSKHLKIIRTWGVLEVEIDVASEGDVDSQEMAGVDPEIFEAADRLTRKRFEHVDLENEVMRRLFEICFRRKVQEFNNGGHTSGAREIGKQSQQADLEPVKKNVEGKIDPRELIKKRIKLPSLPIIFNQINEAIEDPKSSAANIANIINTDAGLCAQILAIVNGAFYGLSSKVDSISRAVAIIGTKQLSTLSIGTCALNVFKDIPSDLIDMKSFWKHNIGCGIIARIIASHKNHSLTERFFLAGLLHDIGRLVMLQSLPLQMKEALLMAVQTNGLLYEAENKVIGFDHALIGGLLVKEWKLPAMFETSISYHHQPSQCENPLDAAIVHISDVMTHALSIGTSGEQYVPPLDAEAWEEIGLPLAALSATVEQADWQIADTVQVFFPNE